MALTAVRERPEVDHEVRRRRREDVRGWAWATPATVLLVLLYIAPIVLVVVMSVSKWSLLGGNQG
ncbi:MAG: hypothetical protein L0J79_06010, partial [Propionibacterium sp.]|nr:hypothetical protein [Propionibacterium sp.]